jgi:hypothetical protein
LSALTSVAPSPTSCLQVHDRERADSRLGNEDPDRGAVGPRQTNVGEAGKPPQDSTGYGNAYVQKYKQLWGIT